jgi:HAE1 family hydrophobic/amphiphilic exporter-1
LTLSPALSALLLKPATGKKTLLTPFYRIFNRVFGAGTNGYISLAGFFVRKLIVGVALVGVIMFLAVRLIGRIPQGFVPEEDQGYMYAGVQLPDSASLQRTEATMRRMEKIVMETPGVEFCTAISGYSMLSGVQN